MSSSQPVLIYDDSQPVSPEIVPLVGRRSYGSILLRGKRLSEYVAASANSAGWSTCVLQTPADREAFAAQLRSAGGQKRAWAIQPARIGPVNSGDFSNLLARLAHAPDPITIPVGTTTLCSGTGTEGLLTSLLSNSGAAMNSLEHPSVEELLVDLSDTGRLLDFLSIGTGTRHFSSLAKMPRTLRKTSSDRRKLKAEYEFFYLIPPKMQRWMVQPCDFSDAETSASYVMERLRVPDMSVLYLHGALLPEDYRRFLNAMQAFLDDRPARPISLRAWRDRADELYRGKVAQRYQQLKAMPIWASLNKLVAAGTRWTGGLDELYAAYDVFAKDHFVPPAQPVEAVIHGDPCFSNILFQPQLGLLRLIDPKGATSEPELWSDPLYDWAKLSHSALGGYDLLNHGLYSIDTNSNLQLCLRKPDLGQTPLARIFADFAVGAGQDLFQIRLAELSLFLSMLPLHADEPRRVLSFILNAINIFDEVRVNA
jgi:hypothetical protein